MRELVLIHNIVSGYGSDFSKLRERLDEGRKKERREREKKKALKRSGEKRAEERNAFSQQYKHIKNIIEGYPLTFQATG